MNPRFTSGYMQFVGGAVIFFAGLAIGWGISIFAPSLADKAFITREGGYQFVNPLLACDISEDVPYSGFANLKGVIEKAIRDAKSDASVMRVSVYFRDLDRGRWTGVNENDAYIPASLNKIGSLIGWLHTTPVADLPNVMLTIPKQNPFQNDVQEYPPEEPLVSGNTYSVETLLNGMIRQSDNAAAFTLYDALATSTIEDVFTSFDVPAAQTDDEQILSPKTYSRFFRILYNASYLGRTKSQYALKMLAQTTFTKGLVAGVPNGVTVAHKFGERTISDQSGSVVTRELHDCGIVYYPHTPYLLCVMTEGSDFPSLEHAIKSVSQTVYQSVDQGMIEMQDTGEGG